MVSNMESLTLTNASDVQLALTKTIRRLREQQKLSRASLSERSGVPAATIKKFELSQQISLRQFLLLWQSVDDLEKLMNLTKQDKFQPQTIQDVLDHE